ncbi:hypothetical protein HPP92_024146 [Vanilla planifolia]|uniref:Remorin C-terminal domain-containing protein n=1 Tax=Vanilla planifolia TaxID=51239 RepID=A0A835PS62_VANPL|nr:hypothetical protein HPP92_024479 [Vanilla planifolia]KAG0456358.1 hypothetical protein HPP92_024146 [Vanilla planifolia]
MEVPLTAPPRIATDLSSPLRINASKVLRVVISNIESSTNRCPTSCSRFPQLLITPRPTSPQVTSLSSRYLLPQHFFPSPFLAAHFTRTPMVAKESPSTTPSPATAGDGGGETEPNPLAIVPSEELPPPPPPPPPQPASAESARREEVESKISSWEAEEVARVTSRLLRQKAIIDGWEADQVEKANAWLKNVERKLEEKRARAVEKTRNEVAVARQRAEERRAEAEATRAEKVGKVLEIARVMKVFGREPSSKRSFFKL